ncbi:TAXI family TRAP transporter solute-binding subunit [Niveispirillum fermenti]|uniref:TAXI family TRAP transporter solute-binding subunit n=1 Tax=Niveispirillum fermenti TaxID=1233113 RepID=UPI003A8B2A54
MTCSRRLPFALLVTLLAAPLLPGSATAQSGGGTPAAQRQMVIASGVVNGLYYPMAGALCRQVNQDRARHGYRCLVEATDGPVYNLNALRAGQVDFAIVQSDWQAAAWRGDGRFAGDGPFTDLRAVATLHAETVTLLVRPGAEIDDITKLKGKSVNLGPRGSALRNLADMVLDAAGVRGLRETGDLMPDAALAALCAGETDAAFVAAGHPNAAIHNATVTCGAGVLPIGGPGIDKLLEGRKDLVRATIPAAVYPGVPEDVASIGVAATLVARAGTDEAAVAEMVRILLEQRPDLTAQHPAFGGVEGDGMAERARTAPLHPVAQKAFAAASPPGR